MKTSRGIVILLNAASVATLTYAVTHTNSPLTPFRTTNTRGGYIIDTVGDTLGQARPENTRLIIRMFAPDKKIVKPAQIALADKSGALINPVFREDRKVGHEENTGLPILISPQAGSNGISVGGVGVDLNKVFGPQGSYAYTKADWPKSIFTGDKRLQITLANGQTLSLPLTSIAK